MRLPPALSALAVAVAIATVPGTPAHAQSATAGLATSAEAPVATSPPVALPDAPDFRLTDIYGDKVQLSDYRGKIVALHFWAIWCASCVPDLRYFQGAYERYGPDVVVLGLAYASGDRESVGGFVESLGVTFPVLMADRELLAAYDVATFPANVIVDRRGKIRHVAHRLMDPRYWDAVLEELVAEEPRN